MAEIEIPVLIIGFNRPDIIEQCFERVRAAKPKKMYVAIDGPRPDRPGEKSLIDDVIKVVKKVDWKCETHYRFSETNIGCEINVSSAVTWALKNEEFIIVLEDDIIAPLSFFNFAQEVLIKFKNNPQIAMVSSNNFTPIPTPDKIDYFFCRSGHTNGWATWKRVWDTYDLNMEIESRYLTRKNANKFFPNKRSANYYRRLFKKFQKDGKGNVTWDWMFDYYRFKNDLFCIVPRENLSSNIGLYGYHSTGPTNVHLIKCNDLFEVKKHPENVFWFKDYDAYHYDKYILGPFSARIRRRIAELCPTKLRQRISKIIHKN